jgi:hypothetical protein
MGHQRLPEPSCSPLVVRFTAREHSNQKCDYVGAVGQRNIAEGEQPRGCVPAAINQCHRLQLQVHVLTGVGRQLCCMGHISPQVLAACADNLSMWTDSQLISAAAVRNVPQHRRRYAAAAARHA